MGGKGVALPSSWRGLFYVLTACLLKIRFLYLCGCRWMMAERRCPPWRALHHGSRAIAALRLSPQGIMALQ